MDSGSSGMHFSWFMLLSAWNRMFVLGDGFMLLNDLQLLFSLVHRLLDYKFMVSSVTTVSKVHKKIV